uniref:Uncharacterized protein n=1 Tax=Anguilla anguilla TaxID=7936 RepID=A0A0E9Q722_ANGAN
MSCKPIKYSPLTEFNVNFKPKMHVSSLTHHNEPLV